jgi:hypothetical protein
MDSELFGSRAIGASIGRAGIPAPDRFGQMRVLGEKRATSCALRSEHTEARKATVRRFGRSDRSAQPDRSTLRSIRPTRATAGIFDEETCTVPRR